MQGRLQLALSKWSPGDSLQSLAEFDAVELDLGSYGLVTPQERSRMRSALQRRSIKIIAKVSLRRSWETEELGDLLSSSFEEFDDALLFWSFVSGFRCFDRIEGGPGLEALRRVREGREELGARPWFFEWGQEDHIASTRFLVPVRESDPGPAGGGLFPGAGFIIDPDHHGRELRRLAVPLHFKLHGWHTERWVRRYGPTQVPRFVDRVRQKTHSGAREAPPSLLILAHSGRIEEGALFRKELDREDPGKD
jgi:hypothetical protein